MAAANGRLRFHQAVAFLPTRQAVPLAKASNELGYAGMYVSDHLFNPKELASRYTYSDRPDGHPGWEPETPWPDPMTLIAGMATVAENLVFTTGVYIAPARDLISVAKSVATAAVVSDDRVRLGVGVGWCKEEFDQTGQDFATRGKRLDEMIVAFARAVARRLGGVPRRVLRRPAVPDAARAQPADPDHRRGPLGGGPAADGGAV